MGGAAAQLRHDSGDALQDLRERRPGHAGHEHVAGSDANQLAFAVHHAGAAGGPAYAGRLAVDARMPAPLLVDYRCRLEIERPCLQQLESGLVHRPFDLDRHAHYRLGPLHEPAELRRLRAGEAGRARARTRGGRLAQVGAARGVRQLLEAGDGLAHPPVTGEHVAVGRHLALRDRRAQTPGRIDEHVVLGSAGQRAARCSRSDQGLNQHGHGGIGGIEIVRGHVAQGARGPQRRPAGAHRGQEFVFAVQLEIALELAGEAGALAILHEGGRAHHHRRIGIALHESGPRREQGVQDLRRHRLAHELQLHVERMTPGLRIPRRRRRCARFPPARARRSGGDRRPPPGRSRPGSAGPRVPAPRDWRPWDRRGRRRRLRGRRAELRVHPLVSCR